MRRLNLLLTLVSKDWQVFLADRRAALLCFAVPILLASVFGHVLNTAFGQADTAPVLPFSVGEGQRAEGDITEPGARRLVRERQAPGASDDAVSQQHTVVSEVAGPARAEFNSYAHGFSGMTLQYLLFWGMEGGVLLLRERQRSVWPRLRAAPIPFGVMLLSRAVSTASIALLMVLATFGFGAAVFGVTVGGSWVGFVLLAIAISVLSAATGLLVAAVGGTEARARSVSVLVILGVSMFGGLWVPAFLLPEWARDAAWALPTTWAMRGFDGVTWRGRGLAAVLPAAAVVAGFAAVFLTAAVARLMTSEARRRRGL